MRSPLPHKLRRPLVELQQDLTALLGRRASVDDERAGALDTERHDPALVRDGKTISKVTQLVAGTSAASCNTASAVGNGLAVYGRRSTTAREACVGGQIRH